MKPLTRLLPLLLLSLMAGACTTDDQQQQQEKSPSTDSIQQAIPQAPEPAAAPADGLTPEPVRWQAFPEGIPLRDGKLYPVDQAAANPEFLAFRTELLAAIDRKDTAFLMRHVDPDVKISIADPGGKDNFHTIWQLNTDPEASPLWAELKEILNMGGIFYEKELTSFSAPYVFHAASEDPYEDLFITGTGVRIRKQPGSAGEVIATLTYDRVKAAPINWDQPEPLLSETIDGETYDWEKIITQAGDTGYVYGKFVRSPIDTRVHFKRMSDGWRLVSLLAGD
jgi:hypothetical protein